MMIQIRNKKVLSTFVEDHPLEMEVKVDNLICRCWRHDMITNLENEQKKIEG